SSLSPIRMTGPRKIVTIEKKASEDWKNKYEEGRLPNPTSITEAIRNSCNLREKSLWQLIWRSFGRLQDGMDSKGICPTQSCLKIKLLKTTNIFGKSNMLLELQNRI